MPPPPPLVKTVRIARHPHTDPEPRLDGDEVIPAARDRCLDRAPGYGNAPSGPEPGWVVGIVLGSIAGFLLVLWLVYTCVNLGNGRGNTNVIVETEGSLVSGSVVTRKSRKHRRSQRHHSRSRSVGRRRETVEMREERVVPPPPERIVVEETTTARRNRGPPPQRMSGPPLPPPPMSDESDDEVVVIEEHTPPRRRESRRHRRRSSERRSSGYRDVDPYRYAGGDEPMRSMSRRRSESRRRYD
ncbi:hypothetical protein PG994_000310 [Apiospora phragmitis]|uniref:Uncharacterized protein n=1 Tax=Apiospora phragmitis TaxID=2905665 RepID=A0ABR1X5Z0_9PEZI